MDPLEALFGSYEPTLSVEDLTAIFGVRRETVYRWIQTGRLPAYRIGTTWVIYRDEVRSWMQAQRDDVSEYTGLAALFEAYPTVLGSREVATLLGRASTTVVRWQREAAVPAYQLGSKWLVIRDELREFLQSSRTGEPTAADHVDRLFAGSPETLPLTELAQSLCVHPQSVYNWLTRGVLPGYKVGGRWMIIRDEIIAALRSARNDCPPVADPATRVGA